MVSSSAKRRSAKKSKKPKKTKKSRSFSDSEKNMSLFHDCYRKRRGIEE
tara:strand:+ start:968 stop:1114 length:147 start_codon:yes stop_codon:yes gene_type:complete